MLRIADRDFRAVTVEDREPLTHLTVDPNGDDQLQMVGLAVSDVPALRS